MKVTAEHMRKAAEVVKDYLTSTNYHVAAFNRVMGYLEQLEKENTQLKDAITALTLDDSTCPSQDDFIRKGRGVLLALVGCAVFWMLVFWLLMEGV